MTSLLERWGSLGIHVSGRRNPFEDPEVLIAESLERYETEGRVLGAMATWLKGYGHLLISKKLKFRSKRARRVFSALLDLAKPSDPKLGRMIGRPFRGDAESLYRNAYEAQKKWAVLEPEPHFLRHGFIVRNHPVIREKTLLPPVTVYGRSIILRYRALYGATLRSDLLARFPEIGEASLRQLSRELHVAPAGLISVIRDFERSGLIERSADKGRYARLCWLGSEVIKVA
ncbi:MAG: hypothetical protein V1798_01225 [Pseudomonadota bacterium]